MQHIARGRSHQCAFNALADIPRLLQVWNPNSPEEEVLVMVCRTGMHTAMGGMIRQLLAPTKQHQDKDSFLLVCSCLAGLLVDVRQVVGLFIDAIICVALVCCFPTVSCCAADVSDALLSVLNTHYIIFGIKFCTTLWSGLVYPAMSSNG